MYEPYDEPDGLSYYNANPTTAGETIRMWSSSVVYYESGTHYITFSNSSFIKYYDYILGEDEIYTNPVFYAYPAIYEVVVG